MTNVGFSIATALLDWQVVFLVTLLKQIRYFFFFEMCDYRMEFLSFVSIKDVSVTSSLRKYCSLENILNNPERH